jgi:outer membrane immunogenic protein
MFLDSWFNRETKFMNRFAVGFLALTGAIAGTAGIASAADMGAPAPVYTKAPIMAPMFSWTGFYIGANVGGAWGNSSDTNAFFAPLTSTGNFSTSGVLGGGQAGYNWQFGSWVLGIETDGDWSNVKGSTSNGLCAGVTCTTSDSWVGTTRGRLGYAVDHWLFYGTGGVAYGDIKFTDLPAAFIFNGSSTNTGWAAGGGIEYAFTSQWSAKLEYLHVDLGSVSLSCALGCGTSTIKFNEDIFRGGVNFHF